jgi:hypothetical protein
VLRLRAGAPKRKLVRCIPVGVGPSAPAAQGPRLSSRAQGSTPAAGTMGLGGVGLGAGRGSYLLSLPSVLHRPAHPVV